MDQRDPNLDPRRVDDLRTPPEVGSATIPILVGVFFLFVIRFMVFGPSSTPTNRTVTGQAAEMPATPPARAPTPAQTPTPGPTNPQ